MLQHLTYTIFFNFARARKVYKLIPRGVQACTRGWRAAHISWWAPRDKYQLIPRGVQACTRARCAVHISWWAPRRVAPRGSLFFTRKKCVITIKGRVNSVSLSFIKMDTRWKHPFTCCVCWPTGCGKTQFVKKFLANLPTICNIRFDRILFYYAAEARSLPYGV